MADSKTDLQIPDIEPPHNTSALGEQCDNRPAAEVKRAKKRAVALACLRGLSVRQIHQETGVSRNTISRYLSGKDQEFNVLLHETGGDNARQFAASFSPAVYQAVPVLKKLLQHEDPKIQLEAVKIAVVASGAAKNAARLLGLNQDDQQAKGPQLQIVVNANPAEEVPTIDVVADDEGDQQC